MTICDYEGHDYRRRFWDQGRDYEDLAERHALRKLLPQRGKRLVEIGAGYGRLAHLYTNFGQVILLDPALSLLQQARETWGHDQRFLFVRGVVGNLPLADSACDTAVMVRVMHHLTDVDQSLAEIARALASGGTFVCEYANKRNLKAIGRFLLRRQSWSPFDAQPVEFAPLHQDFHPGWMADRFRRAGLASQRALAVSSFRLPLLKRLVPARILAALDGLLQPLGGRFKLAPSIFLRARLPGTPPAHLPQDPFRCPACHATALQERYDGMVCAGCSHHWPIRDGIYDFGDQGAATDASSP